MFLPSAREVQTARSLLSLGSLGSLSGLLLGLLLESRLGEFARVEREIGAVNITDWLDFS